MEALEQTLDSREVAVMVGRTHDNVLKDIRNIIKQIGGVKNHESYFVESTYVNTQNKELPCYELTKIGCELYGTRMSGTKGTQFAVAYIERFNQMEQHLISGQAFNIPTTLPEALRLSADLAEKNQVLEQQLLEVQPKLNYLDIILSSKDTVTITQIAADYGMSAREMNKVLHKLGIQHKVGGQWILYKKHMRKGYTKSHTNEIPKADGRMKVVMNTKWTQKGRIFLYNYLKDSGYYPQIDLEVDESA